MNYEAAVLSRSATWRRRCSVCSMPACRSARRSLRPDNVPMMDQPNRDTGLVTEYDSVTRVPSPSDANSYLHSTVPPKGSVRAKANARPGSATVTTGLLLNAGLLGILLRALKRAPTAGPVAPPSHPHST